MIVVGCGYSGERLAQRELDAGRRCTGVVASDAGLARLTAQDIPAARWDLDTDEAAPDLAFDVPLVYLVPPARDRPNDPRLERCLRQLPSRPTRIVYASTTGVYGNRDGAIVDEDSEPDPQSPRAQRRLAAERALRAWCESQGVPWIVLRVPGIYGPQRLQLATLDDPAPMLRPQDAGPGNRIHVDDLVRCLQAAATTPHTDEIYNIGDGNPITNTEFVALVARHRGVPAPAQADRASVQAAVGARRWSFLRESRRVDTSKMRSVLGVVPRYGDPGDGIAASLASMQGASLAGQGGRAKDRG